MIYIIKFFPCRYFPYQYKKTPIPKQYNLFFKNQKTEEVQPSSARHRNPSRSTHTKVRDKPPKQATAHPEQATQGGELPPTQLQKPLAPHNNFLPFFFLFLSHAPSHQCCVSLLHTTKDVTSSSLGGYSPSTFANEKFGGISNTQPVFFSPLLGGEGKDRYCPQGPGVTQHLYPASETSGFFS